jgi:hypothetical protein
MNVNDTAEGRRLAEARDGRAAWRRWGPYLSERQWGTVREDYSEGGNAWDYFSHDQARSRAYRWGEDGIGGLSDERQRLCFALALWNGADPILKERLFGLTGSEGNHGEDVKEYYWYLDATPSHAYARMLYKYPQRAFPYADLVETNRRRGKHEGEYELVDTGIFAEDRYFDVTVEHAKAGPNDLLIRISATNHGPEPAELHLLPTLWFRNTWSWDGVAHEARPILRRSADMDGRSMVLAEHPELGSFAFACEGDAELLFTENETNPERVFGVPNGSPYVKDGINAAVVDGRAEAVNPDGVGTKVAAWYCLVLRPGETATIRARLARIAAPRRNGSPAPDLVGRGPDARPPIPGGTPAPPDFDALMEARIAEADEFYGAVQPAALDDEARMIQRQAFAGLLWSKQTFLYDVATWLAGDTGQPPPPAARARGRNREWRHFNSNDVMSMPDAWEYPWFAAWDLAFHCVPFALIDPDFAKEQLVLLGREWFQHPNGQLPAYEWAFGDVNPPVQAWAAWRVYEIERDRWGREDGLFLERVFHKLMLNFTWWVNRKDAEGDNVFQGGFLGLDNIGVFDRGAPLPIMGHIEQSDGTSWMGMFCLNMLSIALELAKRSPAYEDVATKFFEHFLYIAHAMHNIGEDGISLWDDEDEFFYDVLHREGGPSFRMKVRSMVGLIPLYGVTTLEPETLGRVPEFRARLEWFLKHRPHLASLVSRWYQEGEGDRRLLALLRGHRMKRVLRRMLDEGEFLSEYGVRAISRHHRDHPYVLELGGMVHIVRYEPGESSTGLFGGNSNWRGPIWFPVNYLIVEALRQFHRYYGDDFRVESPTGSGAHRSLAEIADDLAERLVSIFRRDADGRRPVFGGVEQFNEDPRWRDLIPFHEYFHGDTGRGVGASHQTGWTALVASLVDDLGRRGATPPEVPAPRGAAATTA